MQRREFLKGSAATISMASITRAQTPLAAPARKPNVVFFLTDEWRAQALRYAGDPNAKTPTFDALAAEGVNCKTAISGLPLCCPARASLMTGQYPLTNGVFINDVPLEPKGVTLGEAFKNAGYQTGYIGKWHLHGSPDGQYGRRDSFIPADKHFGFDYWKASECDHNYNHERYFVDNDPKVRFWPGYAPIAETADACSFIESHAHGDNPFFLMLSLAPPHFPYGTAPEEYRAMFAGQPIQLRPNVPDEDKQRATESARGYFAHIAALDACMKNLLATLDRNGISDDTIIVFSADHGDMLFSQGLEGKLYPWDESIRIPLLFRYPRKLGRSGRTLSNPINSPDIMPTILGLAGIPVPSGVQGIDFSDILISGDTSQAPRSAFINMPVSNFQLLQHGFDSFRGVRTEQYSYIRAIEGAWLLYDVKKDPYQIHNLIGKLEAKGILLQMEAELDGWLKRLQDEFLPGHVYLERAKLTNYFEVKTAVGQYRSPWGDWGSTMPPDSSPPA
jgi:arylsulfatase A-like enzyme